MSTTREALRALCESVFIEGYSQGTQDRESPNFGAKLAKARGLAASFVLTSKMEEHVAALASLESETEPCADCGGQKYLYDREEGTQPCIGCDATGVQPKGSRLPLPGELSPHPKADALIDALHRWIVRSHHHDKCRKRTEERCDCGKHQLAWRVMDHQMAMQVAAPASAPEGEETPVAARDADEVIEAMRAAARDTGCVPVTVEAFPSQFAALLARIGR